ncbi:dTDP-4-amino-4,6-dideoxygalactose transaminase [Candidatus Harpocratesius sp.]
MVKINFNKPYFTGKEFNYMKEAIDNSHISGDGIFCKRVKNFIESKFNAIQALFVTSCTAALDMSAILLDLKPGDEVIMPSYTFVSTANAVVLRGARIRFADIDPHTLNIDPEDIKRKITSRTKAIYPVHYAGISCKMDEILKIAQKNNLKVVEDAAQGVNAKYKDRYLGTLGDIGCYSFHETKNYQCGEGGAILINNPEYFERAEIIREKGTNRSKFFRGQVDKYTWVDLGSSYIGSDLLAAYLWAQFEELDVILEKRKQIYDFYNQSLKDLEENGILQLPTIPEYCSPNYHIFYIICKSGDLRDFLLRELKKKGIGAVFHYIPLHTSPMGQKFGFSEEDLPITDDISKRLIRLPLHLYLTHADLSRITETIHDLISKYNGL